MIRYTLQFATNLACPLASAPPVPSPNPTNITLSTKLSGGWGFVIFVVVLSFVYIVGGMGCVGLTRHACPTPLHACDLLASAWDEGQSVLVGTLWLLLVPCPWATCASRRQTLSFFPTPTPLSPPPLPPPPAPVPVTAPPPPSFVRVTRHRWEFPNAAFWDNFGNYVNDGITVVLHCKTSAVRGGSSSYAGVVGGNPYDASSVPAASAPPAKFSSGGTSGGYHGGTSSAYTDI